MSEQPKKKRAPRKKSPAVEVVRESGVAVVEEDFLGGDEGAVVHLPERLRGELRAAAGSQDPAAPSPARIAYDAISTGAVFREVRAREHVELEAQSGKPRSFPEGSRPVVKVHVRRGQDGAAAKRALLEAGAEHVVVAPVPSDAAADLPQREVLASDPAEVFREYARRHPPPPGTDLEALARELFSGA